MDECEESKNQISEISRKNGEFLAHLSGVLDIDIRGKKEPQDLLISKVFMCSYWFMCSYIFTCNYIFYCRDLLKYLIVLHCSTGQFLLPFELFVSKYTNPFVG